MLFIVTPQKMQQIHVFYFFLHICLWMESCRPLKLSVHLLSQFSPKYTKKYCIPIWDDAPWYLKVHLDFLKEQVYFFLSLDGIFTRHENAHFVEPINYHK